MLLMGKGGRGLQELMGAPSPGKDKRDSVMLSSPPIIPPKLQLPPQWYFVD